MVNLAFYRLDAASRVLELLPVQFLWFRFLKIYVIGRKWEARLLIPFFIGIWGVLNHWYHLFVLI